MSGARIMIVAGEASGDRHAAGLVREALRQRPELSFEGVGGVQLRAAGVTLFHDASELGVVGISEVIARLPAIRAALADLKRRLRESPPDALLLIDFPDFNLMLAKVAAEIGVRVVYFISPQLWAWRKGRIRIIRKRVSRMIVLFPFEKEFYEQHDVEVTFAGHPLADLEAEPQAKEHARRELGLSAEKAVFGLLPGSRAGEIARHIEPMIAAARIVYAKRPEVVFLLPIAETIARGVIEEAIGTSGLPIIPLRDVFGTIVAACDAALVASGTATLEVACRGVPQVVVYRLSPLTGLIGRMVLRVKFVSLVNLVAGRAVVPELIQGAFTPERAASELLALASPGKMREKQLAGLAQVRGSLGQGGAYRRAADALLEQLDLATAERE